MKKEREESQIILYQSENGQAKINVHFEGDTAWLTQKLMAELFEVTVPTVNEHLRNIFETAELNEKSVIRNFRITAGDGWTKSRSGIREVQEKAGQTICFRFRSRSKKAVKGK